MYIDVTSPISFQHVPLLSVYHIPLNNTYPVNNISKIVDCATTVGPFISSVIVCTSAFGFRPQIMS